MNNNIPPPKHIKKRNIKNNKPQLVKNYIKQKNILNRNTVLNINIFHQ